LNTLSSPTLHLLFKEDRRKVSLSNSFETNEKGTTCKLWLQTQLKNYSILSITTHARLRKKNFSQGLTHADFVLAKMTLIKIRLSHPVSAWGLFISFTLFVLKRGSQEKKS